MTVSYTEGQKKSVVDALESEKYEWRTILGVAKETGLSPEIVDAVIRTNPDLIVKSSLPSSDGEELFTTRAHFTKTAGTFKKLLGAFKNRAS